MQDLETTTPCGAPGPASTDQGLPQCLPLPPQKATMFFEHKAAQHAVATSKCRCERRNAACSNQPGLRESRCPCLKAGLACTNLCLCIDCTNPFGTSTRQTQPAWCEPSRKRPPPPVNNQHHTRTCTATEFLSSKHLAVRTGTYTSMEYFLILCIMEGEYGLLAADALPAEDLHNLYTIAVKNTTALTTNPPVYVRTQASLLQLAQTVKRQYNFTAEHCLTH